MRFVAEQKKRMRRANEIKGQRLAGSAVALCGAGVLSYGHADLVLSCLRDPNFVGSMLLIAGVGTALSPTLRNAASGAAGLREEIRGLRVQMASTQASVEDLLREVKDEEESPRAGSPSKVLHLRGVPRDASVEDIDSLFTKTSPPTRILPLMHKNQALVQFDTVYDATTALGALGTEGLRIGKKKILGAYSMWPELNRSPRFDDAETASTSSSSSEYHGSLRERMAAAAPAQTKARSAEQQQ